MSPATTQTILAVAAGAICLVAVVIMGRRRRLSLRFTAGWSLLGLSTIVFGAITPFLDEIAPALNMSPVGLVLVVSVSLVLLILFMVSVSVVGLQRDIQDLVEEIALLRSNIDERDDN